MHWGSRASVRRAALYYVALGAAYCAEETVSLDEFERRLKRDGGAGQSHAHGAPLPG